MKRLQSVVLITGGILSSVAAAQEAGSAKVEEVVITARKAEENLQDVPIAVSAFTADQMDKRSMRELEDVALGTPGFSFEDYGGGFGVPVIRGGSQLRIQDLDQTTSVYLDGIYLPRQYMVDFGTLGFERIEVVKGPQSALFGRNAFLGAVNYVSGGPGEELEAKVSGTYGSDDLLEYYGQVGGPLIDGILGARLVGSFSEFDGTWDNEHPNAGLSWGKRGSEDNLAGYENSTWGLNIEATPVEPLLLELDYYHVERFQENNAGIRVQASTGDTNCSNGRFYCGEIPDKFVPLPGGSPAGTKMIADPRAFLLDVETDFVHAGATWDFNDAWSATYQFGYTESEVISAGGSDRDPLAGSFNFVDFAANPANYFLATPIGTNEYTSHELRVEFNSGAWSALFGGFTSEIEDKDNFDFVLAPYLGTDPFKIDPETGTSGVTALAITRSATEVNTDAIFARVAWESPSSVWRLGLEGRYQDEEKILDSETRVSSDALFKDSWQTFTPRFTVDYHFNDEQMLYSSLAKGAKSGGFNNTVFNESQRAFDPDENWTLEIGSKNELLDGVLRLNGAIYYTDWDDLQINSTPIDMPDGTTAPAIVANTGGAEIWGVELDGIWFPTDMLSIDYAISYSDTEFKSGSKSARAGLIGACDGIVCPADGDISGQELPRQPAFQANLGAALTGYLGGWEWYARADVVHQSKQYIDEFNLAYVPERTLFNSRLQLSNENWVFAVWGKNLTDEEYIANAFFTQTASDTQYTPIFGQKRTVGLTVSYEL